MKILVISAAFYPANSPRSFRTTELVKELIRQAHEVTLITPHAGEQFAQCLLEWGITHKDPGLAPAISFRSNISLLDKLLRFWRRLIELVADYPDIRYRAWAKQAVIPEAGYDLCISIAAPHAVHWGVAAAIKQTGRKPAQVWIADCGDPYMGGKMSTIPAMPWFSFFEKAFCRLTDHITVPVASAIQAYYPAYRSKISVITQGFKFEESQQHRLPYTANEVPTFAFAGALSPKMRDPRPLMRFLNQLKMPFRFTIFTNATGLVAELAAQSEGRIQVLPYIPREVLIGKLSQMDFLVNIENEVAEQVPSKLIDYHLIGRPVLSIHARTDFDERLMPFLAGDYTQAFVIPNADEYRIENVVAKFLRLASANQ
jgi:glycosyltransferase involved in cell wall biosynthesis